MPPLDFWKSILGTGMRRHGFSEANRGTRVPRRDIQYGFGALERPLLAF